MRCLKDAEMTRKAGDWILLSLGMPEKRTTSMHLAAVVVVTIVLTALFWATMSRAEGLQASWYSVQSLKDEGTWSYSKGVMANGRQFSDDLLVCATRDWPLGAKVKVTRTDTKAFVVLLVADRTAKRFAGKRIDLSKKAFSLLAPLERGLIPVQVEVIK